MTHDEFVKNILANTDSNGRIKCRERNDLEYKKTYGEKSWLKYAKSLAAFANNRGGYILFGITDNPREVVEVNESFNDFKQEDFTAYLNSLFAPELHWESGIVDINNKNVGYIYVEEAYTKPVIALKNETKEKITINSGDVFYRYRARSEKIKYPEMRHLIEVITDMKRDALLSSFETILKSGTTNIGIINYDRGTFSVPKGLPIDQSVLREVLKKAKFIKEGSFNETSGQPVLKVTGNIDLAEEVPVPDIEPDVQYPYLQKNMANKLGVSTQTLYALIWKYNMKNIRKFHFEVTTSSSPQKVHKFSDMAVQYIAEKLNENKDNANFLEDIRNEYQRRND